MLEPTGSFRMHNLITTLSLPENKLITANNAIEINNELKQLRNRPDLNVLIDLMPVDSGLGNDLDAKELQRSQQQRLCLLRHTFKCPHESGRCPVTPHCWGTKLLWVHAMDCGEGLDCKVLQCSTTKHILSHYSHCKFSSCPVCGPVREAIKRNYARHRAIAQEKKTKMAGEDITTTFNSDNQNSAMSTCVNVISGEIVFDEEDKYLIRSKRKGSERRVRFETGGSDKRSKTAVEN
jgi:hypothetical protein